MRLAAASGEPVYVTQAGRTTAVPVSRLSYERLRRDLEILSRVVVGDLDVSLREGLALGEILARGEWALAEERSHAAEERAAAERRLAAEERAAMRPARTPTREEFLVSEGFDHLVLGPASGAGSATGGDAVCDAPSVWYSGAGGE